jgi:biotin synthase-like enzyme
VVASLKELKDPTLSLVDAYNQTSKRSQDLEVLRGIINGLGEDPEEVTKQIKALRKVRAMII